MCEPRPSILLSIQQFKTKRNFHACCASSWRSTECSQMNSSPAHFFMAQCSQMDSSPAHCFMTQCGVLPNEQQSCPLLHGPVAAWSIHLPGCRYLTLRMHGKPCNLLRETALCQLQRNSTHVSPVVVLTMLLITEAMICRLVGRLMYRKECGTERSRGPQGTVAVLHCG